ncbi:thiolase family protein [Leifsonia sp. NCR5]|uniref:thiolase family protein n=1 Tax=Leifsonia sp. NCR5 TaxID=1978342 RepID=UPI00211A1CBC|nr:thiolase family protein [Leifsonia sp. NCR5]
MSGDPIVVAARRTPIATRGRGLAEVTVDRLAAPVLRAVLEDWAAASTPPHPTPTVAVADVVLGNCMGPGGNPARVAALLAGLGVEVPGMTVDRQCGSGLAAVIEAANAIRGGDERPRIAGGVESASTAPVRSVDGVPYDRAPFAPTGFPDPGMTEAAERLAAEDRIPRSRQDAYAARSRRRSLAAVADGRYAGELVPVEGVSGDELGASGADERVLARFAPLFEGGSVTGGNSCRVSDGAAAVLLVPGALRGVGVPGLALRADAVVGCDPALPGVGAAAAILEALGRVGGTGRTVADVAAFEIVEAFASQTIAVLDRIGVADGDVRVCTDGGALALGHPWGASGAVAVVRLFSRLVRGGAPAGTLGVAAASVGGGMGVAAVFEVVR